MATLDLPLPVACGQLVVGGFSGHALTARFATALREGRRGGAILFKRNIPDVDTAAAICESVRSAAQAELPPFVAVDQEGGRVQRLREPVLQLPPMRALGALGDLALVRRAARALGGELAAIGFNLDFAPVLDVDSNPQNPVIGDRSFGTEPRSVMRNGVAFLQGLQEAGVLACGKHFPGHGDTDVDSHVSLPVVRHDRARLEHVELPPFRAASGAGIASMMTAHVVCEALDAGVPATMSRAVCASLLRAEIGFEGVLFSDDLEMGAIRAWGDLPTAAVEAVWAGCDALLVCSDEDAQDAVHEALVTKAEQDRRFRDRCLEAAARSLRVRRLCPPRPVSRQARDAVVGGEASRAVAKAIEDALSARGPTLS